MRKKYLVARARVRTPSIDTDPDEADGEYGLERNVNNKTGGNHERQFAEDGGDGEDPLRKKLRTLGDNESDEIIDELKVDACIVCDGKDDQVLACRESGCLVVLHGQCMKGEPDFDELGNFYCPYCWYKRQVLRSRKLKEKAMAAEKAVADEKGMTVDMDVVTDKTSRETKNVVEVICSLGKMRNLSHCEDKREDGELGNQRTKLDKNHGNKMCMDEILEFDVPRDGERRRTKDLKEVEGSKREGRAKDQRQRAEEEKVTDRFDVLEDDRERIQEPLNDFYEDEQMQPNASPSISSPTSTNGSDGCDPDAGGFALVVRPRHIVGTMTEEAPPYSVGPSRKLSARCGNSRIGNRSNQAVNVVVYTSPTKRKNFIYGNGKRKRLFWTPEEEEMLRIGVEKFSAVVNKNIPWRKILDFGQHVFHEERTPSDLKDKWKNMNKPT